MQFPWPVLIGLGMIVVGLALGIFIAVRASRANRRRDLP